MPLITNEDALARLSGGEKAVTGFVPQPQRLEIGEDPNLVQVKPTEPTLSEEYSAAFRQENMVSSLLASGKQSFEYDDTYDYTDDLEGYEQFESILAASRNAEHTIALKNRIDQEQADKDILARGGVSAIVAQMVAGTLDPTILIPFGGVAAKGLKGVGQIAKLSATTAGVIGVQEAALQSTQLLRTKEESIYAMVGGALFAGALGGVGYAMLRKSDPEAFGKLKKEIVEDLASDETIDFNSIIAKNNGDIEGIKADLKSVGAAQVSTEDIARLRGENRAIQIAGDTIKGAAGVEKVLKKMTPLLSTLQSDLVSSRDTIQKLLSNPLRMVKNEEFRATSQSVEQLREQYTANFLNTQDAVTDIYKQYKKRVGKGSKLPLSRDNIVEKFKAKIGGKEASQTSFMEEVGKAMRRGDKHPIKEVQDSAIKYRKFFDDTAQEALDSGIWEGMPDRKTAESYFSRVFDNDVIEENLQEFTDVVRNWVGEQTVKMVDNIEAKYKRLEDNYIAQIDDLEVNKFRKASFLQEQAEIEGKEIGLSAEDIKVSMEYLANGKPRKPKTLLNFISESGGLDIDDANFKDLNADDISNWNKSNFKKLQSTKDKGAKSIDEMAFRAWENGYFPEFRERPELNELLNAIDDELKEINFKVKDTDIDDWQDFQYYKEIEGVVNQLGLNPKDYKKGKVLLTDSNLKDFREKLAKVTNEDAKLKRKKIEAKITRLADKKADELEDINTMGVEMYSDEVTDGIVSKIRGLDGVQPEFKIDVAERGPLKEQKFLIPDSAVEKFLISDADVIAERYARTMGTDIELTKKFGSPKLEDILAPITREFKEQGANMNAQDRVKLKKQFDKDKQNIEAIHQIMKGTYANDIYSNPDKWYKDLAKMTLAYNYVRMLGGVAISSIPDVAKLVQYNGVGSAFKDGIIPIAKALPKIIRGLRPDELKELKLAGTTIEHLNNQRAMSLADAFNRFGNETSMEKYINASTKVFSKATGIIAWNNLMQSIGGIMVQKRIARNVLNIVDGGTLSKKETEYMAFLGFSKEDAKEIGALIKKHGKTEKDGFISVNTEKWENAQLRMQYRAALKKDVESIVLQKDLGDVPMFANSGIGRVLLQFKSFMFASTTKTLMAGLQKRDRAQVEALATFISLGALTYVVKTLEGGREPDYDPMNLIVQGIDRSGVLGVFMEANNIAEKVGIAGLNRLAGQPTASRYMSRSLDEALLGPTLGTITNIGSAIYGAQQDEMTDSDKRNIRKLVPFSNLFYLRWLMNSLNEGTRKEFGY